MRTTAAPRWTGWEDVGPTGWEDIGELEISAERQAKFLAAVEAPAAVTAELGIYVHPSVLAQVAGMVLSHFDPPRPPHRLLSRQYSRIEGPVCLGERLHVIGRLSEKVGSGNREGYSMEAWILGTDGAPRFFHRMKVRVIAMHKVVQ